MNTFKQMRLKSGLTQKEVGIKVGVGTSTVGMWENGTNKPRASTIIKLSAIFGCSVDDLLREAEVTNENG